MHRRVFDLPVLWVHQVVRMAPAPTVIDLDALN